MVFSSRLYSDLSRDPKVYIWRKIPVSVPFITFVWFALTNKSKSSQNTYFHPFTSILAYRDFTSKECIRYIALSILSTSACVEPRYYYMSAFVPAVYKYRHVIPAMYGKPIQMPTYWRSILMYAVCRSARSLSHKEGVCFVLFNET